MKIRTLTNLNWRFIGSIFTRRRTYCIDGKCSRCKVSSLWKDKITPRQYCPECGSRYISLGRHIKIQLYGFRTIGKDGTVLRNKN